MNLFSSNKSERKPSEAIQVGKPAGRKLNEFLINASVFMGFAGVLVFFSISSSSFLTGANITDIFLRISITGPIAFGIMLSIILKGINLTPGAVVGLVGLTVTATIRAGYALPTAIFLAFLVGAVFGLVTAFAVAKAKMNPFIATVAIMFVGDSVARVTTQGGLPIYIYRAPEAFSNIYRGSTFFIPNPIFILLVTVLIYYLVLERMKYGRRLYAAGLSIKAARAAGIRVNLYYGIAYFFATLSAVLPGIIVASQVRSGQPLIGHAYLWDGIGAAFLSTIISKGGRPNILGALFGAVVLSTVDNGLTLIGVPFYWKEFARGLIILAILVVATLKNRRT